MPRNRTVEPIAPTNIPGEPLDPKIPPELEPTTNDDDFEKSNREESDESPLG